MTLVCLFFVELLIASEILKELIFEKILMSIDSTHLKYFNFYFFNLNAKILNWDGSNRPVPLVYTNYRGMKTGSRR
jgi:hypothetical protein